VLAQLGAQRSTVVSQSPWWIRSPVALAVEACVTLVAGGCAGGRAEVGGWHSEL